MTVFYNRDGVLLLESEEGLYESKVLPTVTFVAETWATSKEERPEA